MGREPQKQPRLFYTRFKLDQRISPNHPLKTINQIIDFDFIYDEVGDTYGQNGNVSVPPPVIRNSSPPCLTYRKRIRPSASF
jgi:transposase